MRIEARLVQRAKLILLATQGLSNAEIGRRVGCHVDTVRQWRAGRFEFEYVRHGTWALLAAFDVRNGKVVGECKPQRRAEDLVAFMENLARAYPKGQVYVVWDNLNIHHDGRDDRWTRFNQRHSNSKTPSTPLAATDDDVRGVETFLRRFPELAHLRVRRPAALLTLESGDPSDPLPHARLRRLATKIWLLEMANHEPAGGGSAVSATSTNPMPFT